MKKLFLALAFLFASVSFASAATVTVTLSDSDIKALPSGAFQILAPTETPGYVGLVASLPVFIRADVYIDTRSAGYTNLSAFNNLLFHYGSDFSTQASIGFNSNRLGNTGFAHLVYLPLVNETNTQGLMPNVQELDGNLNDNGIYLALLNGGNGNLTGGDAANSIRVVLTYETVGLP